MREKTGKGKQFEIQRLKENRKTVLVKLTKQINTISPLLADFERKNKYRLKLRNSISYLLKCKKHPSFSLKFSENLR